MRIPNRAVRALLLAGASAVLLSACALGPNYKRPSAPMSADYKGSAGWKPAMPSIPASDQTWWAIYNDPVLDALEKQIDVSNQNLKQAEAAYRAARAAVDVSRGGLLPDVNINGSGNKSSGRTSVGTTGGGSIPTPTSSGNRRSYQATAQAGWEIDLWGRIRRQVEASAASAEASAADLAGARLTLQTTLAQNYFQLRAVEQQKRLLDQSVQDFEKSLQVIKNRLAVGVASPADVYQAQTQVDSAIAQSVGLDLTRAQLENAIAVLVGKPPSDFSLASGTMPADIPVVPAGVPSSLLERRPDIAAAERRMKAANAEVGVAIAAFFPNISLSGTYGFTSTALESLFDASNAEWSYGAAVAETIFNGGSRLAQTSQARAQYDASVAAYRETVLEALQEVENDLTSLRVLERQGEAQATTVQDARKSEEIVNNQYRAGIADQTTVVISQAARLNAEISALNILSQRLSSSVALVTALGGGWTAADMPRTGFFYSLPDDPLKKGKKKAVP